MTEVEIKGNYQYRFFFFFFFFLQGMLLNGHETFTSFITEQKKNWKTLITFKTKKKTKKKKKRDKNTSITPSEG